MRKITVTILALQLSVAAAGANALANAGFEQNSEHWQSWNNGLQIDTTTAHSGNAALRLDFSRPESARGFGAHQTIELNQTAAAPITIGIWGKASAVTRNSDKRGRDGSWCRLSVSAKDQNGKQVFNWDSRRQEMHFYFEGDFDWTYQERTLVFSEPIKSLTVFLQGRDCSGQVWFDDLLVLNHNQEQPAAKTAYSPCELEEIGGQVRLENQFLKLLLDPAKGGRIYSIIDKQTGKEFTTTRANGGLAKDVIKEIGFSDLFAQFYLVEKKHASPEEVSVTLRGHHSKQEFLTILKTYTLRQDSSELLIDYELANAPEAMTPRHFTLRNHNELKVPGEKTRYLFPTSQGTSELMEGGGMEAWQNDIVQGWAALLGAESGNGLLCQIDFPALECFYNWFGEETNLEWFYKTVRVEAGESWKTRIAIMPLHQAGSIAAAKAGLAVEFTGLEQPPPPGQALDFGLKIHAARETAVELMLKATALPSGETVLLQRGSAVVGPGLSSLQKCSWQHPFSGTTLLTCALYDQNHQLLLEARTLLTSGEKTAEYVFPPEAEKIPTVGNLPKAVFMSKTVSTPHLPWARPLPGKPLQVLGLINSFSARELAELQQRLDIEYTPVVFCQGFALPDYFMQYSKDDSNVWLQESLQKEYDLILIGGIAWNHINAANQKSIVAKIEAGCSLVYVYPVGINDVLAAILPVQEPVENKNASSGAWTRHGRHFITDGIPFEALPPAFCFRYTAEEPLLSCDGHALAAVRQLPHSRVVALTHPVGFPGSQTGRPWWAGGGLTPTATAYEKTDSSLAYPYHEYFYALLARAILWAAVREPSLTISTVTHAEQSVQVAFAGKLDDSQDLHLAWELRDDSFAILEQGSHTIENATTTALLTIPQFFGTALLHLQLKKGAAVLDFAATRLSRPSPLRLLAANTAIVADGEAVELTGTLQVAGNGKAELRLQDSWQRLVARQTITVTEGSNNFRMTFTNPIARAFRLDITGLADGSNAGTLHQWCYLKNGRRKYADYPVNIWLLDNGFLHIPEYLNDLRMQRLAAADIFDSVMLHNTGWRDIPTHIANTSEFLWRHNLEVSLNNLAPQHLNQKYFNENKKQYQETGDKKFLCRKPCLHDPQTQLEDQKRIRQMIATIKEYQPAHYSLGDENSLTMWGQSFDFCFSEATLAAFRKWLPEKYASLEQLNQTYQSAYQSFQEVMPLTSAEAAEQKNYAAWLDHRAFMDQSMAEFYQQTKEFVQQLDPGCPISISGTVPTPNPYSGYDWYLFMQVFNNNLLAPYSGIQTSLIRSYADDNFIAMPFNGGYARTGAPLFHSVWLTAFEYKGGGNSFFIDDIALNPDLTFSRQLEDYDVATADLRYGLGQLLRQSRRDDDKVLVLYSQNSMRMATITGQGALFNNAIDGWRLLLDAVGCQYRFIASQQMAQLDPEQHQLLILPFCISLAEEEKNVLEKYLRSGGAVIADYGLGLYDGHGRTSAAGSVAELLGVNRGNGQVLPGQLTFADLQVRVQLQDDSTTATSATVLATVGGHPAVFSHAVGQGKTIYANFLFDQFPSLKNSCQDNRLYQQLLWKMLRHAGKESFPALVTQADGLEPHCTRLFRFRNGEHVYLGLLQELNSEEKFKRLKVNLAQSRHVYNIRQRQYLGQLQEFELELSPGEAAFFSLLPGPAAPPALALSPASVAPGGVLECRISLPASGQSSRQVVRLEVISPDGKLCKHYCRNRVSDCGLFTQAFATALSDQTGTWLLRATDLSSGLSSTAKLQIHQ
ncbi:MAG: hypothetical protein GX902_00885 [Lentisphaerae bacterium]|nr:hypothetical protein [Lentisphaerota bacterium]